MTTRTPWTDPENAAIVALYFAMLDRAAYAGEPYNKASMIRQARGEVVSDAPYAGKLTARSRGSIEAKLMNCSAAHRDLNPQAVTMDSYGYRCLSNYQKALKVAMLVEMTRLDQRDIKARSA